MSYAKLSSEVLQGFYAHHRLLLGALLAMQIGEVLRKIRLQKLLKGNRCRR